MKKTTTSKALALFLAIATLISIMTVTVLTTSAATGASISVPATANTSGSSLNVRSGPGTTYSIAGSIAHNASMTIVGYAADSSNIVWYKISSPAGYVRSDYVTSNFSKSAKLNGGSASVNVRSSASTSGAIVKSYATNTSVTVTSIVAGSDGYAWFKISSPVSGYVRADLVAENGTNPPTPTTGFAWPTSPGYRKISSPYGYRTDPKTGAQAFHGGIDIVGATAGAIARQPVKASKGGIAYKKNFDANGYGNWVEIKHDDGTYTRYGHLDSVSSNISASGTRVAQGDEIGKVGTTGKSTGYHLHFEIRINGNGNDNRVDPLTKLPAA